MAIAHYNFKVALTFSSFIFLIIFSPIVQCVTDEEALLEFKKSLQNTEALNSWLPNTTPCQDKNANWNGVVCYEGIIIGLRLKSMGLSGKIDVNALSNLPGLRSISLDNNQFNGPIPEFNRLGSLKGLYMSNNQFSGSIPPDYFSKLGKLKKLWLSNNQFSGDIPSSLAQLGNLLEIHLDNNNFSGTIPPFKKPPLLSLSLSNNQLQGEIPPTLSKFNASSFDGNPNLCGDIVGRDCSQAVRVLTPPTTITNSNDKHHTKAAGTKLAVGVGICVLILSLVLFIFCVTKRHNEEIPTANPILVTTANPMMITSFLSTKSATNSLGSSRKSNVEEEIVGVVEVEGPPPILTRKDSNNSSGGRRSTSGRKSTSNKGSNPGGMADLTMINDEKGAFGLADLMKASAEVLGNGSMGSAYKAVMSNGLAVVVKRMRELNALDIDAFDKELRSLACLRHENVLPPLAYHYRKEEKLIVYEYATKGSLHYILHGEKGPTHDELNWPTRLKIIKEITYGLHYLHSELDTHDLPHGNLKSSNILINTLNKPLLSDYGFNTMTNPKAASHALFAYRSPESLQNQRVSPKCDIFCLGVVILEIMTGKYPSQYLASTKTGTDVVQWAASAIAENREDGLLDLDMISKSTGFKDGMVELIHIGASCTATNPNERPTLEEIMERIERIQE